MSEYFEPSRCCVCGEEMVDGEWYHLVRAYFNGRELFGASHKACGSPPPDRLRPMPPTGRQP